METHREDLRDNLIAALDAAEELPREDRRHLADVFLDSLEAGYELVPRSGRGGTRRAVQPTRSMSIPTTLLWPAIVIGGLLVFVVFSSLLWLTSSTFAMAHGHHPPVPLPVLPFLFAIWFFRFRRWGRWGRTIRW